MTTSINSQLEAHFSEWAKEANIPPDHFHKDGVIHEGSWRKAEPRVCFLMKEPNNPSQTEDGQGFDFRDWWRDEPIKYRFPSRIAEWSRGMLEGFPPYDELWSTNDGRDIQEVRKQIALVNVKKTGGGGTSEYHSFMQEALGAPDDVQAQDRSAARVLKQLDIIDPQVIVLGLSWPGLIERLFKKEVEWKPTGHGINVGNWKGRRLIDFYHPSIQGAPTAYYYLLEKVWRSEAFKSLAPV